MTWWWTVPGLRCLGGAADLAVRGGDVVDRLVPGVYAERTQCFYHPLVEEGILPIDGGHSGDEFRRGVDRVRDNVLGLDEHGHTPGHPAYDLNAVLTRRLFAD